MKKLQSELKTQIISIDSLLLLGNKLSEHSEIHDFDEYIKLLAKDIEESSGIKVIKAAVKADDEEVKKLLTSSSENGLSIVYYSGEKPYKHRILQKLPEIYDNDSEPLYTLLGMNKKMNTTTIKSIAIMFAATYVYFNVFKDAEQRMTLFLNLIQCMMSAIDAKDPVTSGHSRRVAKMSKDLAEWMGLNKDMVRQVEISGMIHDLGKIGIPDDILAKPAPLSDNEFAIMKEHPLKGGAIISAIKPPDEMLDGILYHHERLDGKGYPYGLTEKDIPVTARIIKVADVYDALTSERKYKKAWSIENTLDFLYTGRGTEFDENIVDLLIDHFKPTDYIPSKLKPKMSHKEGILEKHYSFFELCMEIKSLWKQNNDYNIGNCSNEGWESFLKDKGCSDSFFGIAWFSGYNTGDFMNCLPYVLYSRDDKIFFVLKGRDKIKNIYYYYEKGFLSAGFIDVDETYIYEICKELSYDGVEGEEFTFYDARKLDMLCGKENVVFMVKNEKKE